MAVITKGNRKRNCNYSQSWSNKINNANVIIVSHLLRYDVNPQSRQDLHVHTYVQHLFSPKEDGWDYREYFYRHFLASMDQILKLFCDPPDFKRSSWSSKGFLKVFLWFLQKVSEISTVPTTETLLRTGLLGGFWNQSWWEGETFQNTTSWPREGGDAYFPQQTARGLFVRE